MKRSRSWRTLRVKEFLNGQIDKIGSRLIRVSWFVLQVEDR